MSASRGRWMMVVRGSVGQRKIGGWVRRAGLWLGWDSRVDGEASTAKAALVRRVRDGLVGCGLEV
jgi:hypothetical protein